MDRTKYPISVVPFPIDRTANARSSDVNDCPDEAEWDSKWLRPSISMVEKQIHPAPEPQEQREERNEEHVSLPIRMLRWLFPEVNQRRAKRIPTPGLVAYYWTGGSSRSYRVGDMSATGLYLLTEERWAPGTLIQMTLQLQDGRVNNSESTLCVLSEVVRWGENGSGFNFILTDYDNIRDYGITPLEALNRKSVERFLGKMGAPVSR